MTTNHTDLIARLRNYDKRDGLYRDALHRAAADALEAMQAAQPKCCGVTRTGCNYLSACGVICNKCGRVHDGTFSGAADPVGLPAGEQTRPSTAAPTLTEDQIAQLWSPHPGGEVRRPIMGWAKVLDFARAIERAARGAGMSTDKTVADDALPAQCNWSQDSEDSDTWGTRCGHYFTLNDGTPAENGMRYCCYCGQPVAEHKFELEQEDDNE